MPLVDTTCVEEIPAREPNLEALPAKPALKQRKCDENGKFSNHRG